jgi:hypothetical protein
MDGARLDAAEAWSEKNGPEGVAFQHEAMDVPTGEVLAAPTVSGINRCSS